MTRERPVVFACGSDALVGILHEASGSRGILVLVGGPQYRVGSHRQFALMARAFAASGFPVLRFDYRGMGDSDGEPRTFEAVADDIRCAIEAFARESPQVEEIVLWGLCDAASSALMFYDADPRIAAMILANPSVRDDGAEARSYLKHYYPTRLLQWSFWERALRGKVDFAAALRGFLDKVVAGVVRTRDAAGNTPSQATFVERMRVGLERFEGRVLILMSGRDLTAQAFRELAAADAKWQRALAQPHVRQRELPDADHTFSARRELDRACEYCLSWLRDADTVGYSAMPTPITRANVG
jgi:exosortase A-associated hydrolase 1